MWTLDRYLLDSWITATRSYLSIMNNHFGGKMTLCEAHHCSCPWYLNTDNLQMIIKLVFDGMNFCWLFKVHYLMSLRSMPLIDLNLSLCLDKFYRVVTNKNKTFRFCTCTNKPFARTFVETLTSTYTNRPAPKSKSSVSLCTSVILIN